MKMCPTEKKVAGKVHFGVPYITAHTVKLWAVYRCISFKIQFSIQRY